MFASFSGNIKLVDLLIQSNAEVNAKDKDNDTALIQAAFRGNATVVKRLLEEGADATVVDNDGNQNLDPTDDIQMISIASETGWSGTTAGGNGLLSQQSSIIEEFGPCEYSMASECAYPSIGIFWGFDETDACVMIMIMPAS